MAFSAAIALFTQETSGSPRLVMYWAVGVSVTKAVIWRVCSADFTSFSVWNTLGCAVGWIWLVMNDRLVVPTWSP